PDGVFGNGDDTSTAGITAGGGRYSYSGAPGNYKVSVGTPSGYSPTATGQGPTATDSNPSPTSLTLTSGQTDNTIDFGFYKNVTIGDFVWTDTNGNGIQDAGEPGIDGVTVTIAYAGPDGVFGNGDDTSTAVVTSGGGMYSYSGAPGNYKVSVGTPSGYSPTATGQGTSATDSNPSPTSLTLTSGQTDNTIDFGFYKNVTIGNFVWTDTNGNGIQ